MEKNERLKSWLGFHWVVLQKLNREERDLYVDMNWAQWRDDTREDLEIDGQQQFVDAVEALIKLTDIPVSLKY